MFECSRAIALARQQAAINSCLDKHLDLSEELKKADSCTSALQTKTSNLDGKRFPQYQHSKEPIPQLENASPSPENTTSEADDDTAGKEHGWIDLSSAYEYAQRQGYEGKKEAFRMLSKSRSPDAAYAQWNLKMDLHLRGSRGQKSKWLLPIDPEHYRQLMDNASAATDD